MFQSLLDDQGLVEVSQIAEQVLDAVNKEHYVEATQLWGKAEMVIEQVTGHTREQPTCLVPTEEGPLVGIIGIRVYPKTPHESENDHLLKGKADESEQ